MRARGRLNTLLKLATGDFIKILTNIIGRERCREAIEELQDKLQTLELESALEMTRQCRHTTCTKNLSILKDKEAEETGSDEYQRTRQEFPVCCKLGLIPAAEDGAFQDGGASAVDLMYLGMIPM